MKKIILIHGINNQDNSKLNIEKEWANALKKGAIAVNTAVPTDVTFNAAFYGDVLFEETENWGKNSSSSKAMSAESPDRDYVNDEIASLYIEYQRKFGISDEQVSAELDEKDNISGHQRMAKGIHKRWLKAITRALEKVLPSKGERLAARYFLPQAAAYLHKPGLKEKIDNLVKTQVFNELSTNDEIIVISHSLGTIVAYSLMLKLRHMISLKLLITAGSPLGIEVVKNRLGPPLLCPPSVETWVNVSDKEDFVALKPKLDGETFGCSKIKNIDHVDNGDEDAHDIKKYLAHGVVAKEIVSHL